MAFGFEKPARGLIVDPAARPEPVRRYLLDFASAYADDVELLPCREETGGGAFDLLFSLDATDRLRASALGAHFVPCFPDPALCAVDAGPHLLLIDNPAAENGRRRVATACLFGPESTGKSTLAAALARHYRTLHVTEYVRGFLDATQSAGTADDVPWIARGQRAAELATAKQVREILICDTNLATIMLWSEILFGDSPHWLREAAIRQKFDLWLVTDIDVPFEPDPQRCFPGDSDRAWLMRQCTGLLDRLGVVPVRLRGGHEERLRIAVDAIDQLLGREQAIR
jgi:nicotinamide riboside kinase